MRLTPNQQSYLEDIQAHAGVDHEVTIPFVYGPCKRTLLSMEKKGLIKVLNKATWSKSNRACVKLLAPWNSNVQQSFRVTLDLTTKELATLKTVLHDIDIYYEMAIKNHRKGGVAFPTTDEIEGKRKLAKAFSTRVRNL